MLLEFVIMSPDDGSTWEEVGAGEDRLVVEVEERWGGAADQMVLRYACLWTQPEHGAKVVPAVRHGRPHPVLHVLPGQEPCVWLVGWLHEIRAAIDTATS